MLTALFFVGNQVRLLNGFPVPIFRNSLGRLHLRRGEPPEARKAFAPAKHPQNPLIKKIMNNSNILSK
jgi:hypothetical protein